MRTIFNSVVLAALLAATGVSAAEDDSQLAKRFAALDADKSGDVTLEEFTLPMKSRLVAADKDKDGKTTAAELAEAGTFPQPAAADVLARFDADKDGAIAVAEVEERRATMFRMLDADADGKLTLAELQASAAKSGKGDRPKTGTQ